MAFKAVVLCVFALSFQSIAGLSCYRPPVSSSGCNSGSLTVTVTEDERPARYQSVSSYQSPNCVSIAIPDNGGSFAVTSLGGIAPSGIAVATDLGLSGDLVLSGALPYLSAVAFEGQFETSGATPVSYGCGDVVAIKEQIGGNGGIGLSSKSLNVNLGGCGCSCN